MEARNAATSPGASGSCCRAPDSNNDDDGTVRGRDLVTPPGTPATPDPSVVVVVVVYCDETNRN